MSINNEHLERLKEKFNIPKSIIPNMEELTIFSRITKIEQIIGEHETKIQDNLTNIKDNASKAVNAAQTAIKIENNMKSAATQLSIDSSEIESAGFELKNTIQNEMARISLAFEVYGINMKKSTVGVSSSAYALGKGFLDTAGKMSYPARLVVEYARRFTADGLPYMAWNAYCAIMHGFGVRERVQGVVPVLLSGFGVIKNNSYALSNNLTIMGNSFEKEPKILSDVIRDASKKIEIAISKFLSKFGALGQNLSRTLGV